MTSRRLRQLKRSTSLAAILKAAQEDRWTRQPDAARWRPDDESNDTMPRESTTVACLVCEESIVLFAAPGDGSLPNDALIFTAAGNFGSDMYNPLPHERDNTVLRVYVCDLCVETKASNGMIQMVRVTTTKTTDVVMWTPGIRFVP